MAVPDMAGTASVRQSLRRGQRLVGSVFNWTQTLAPAGIAGLGGFFLTVARLRMSIGNTALKYTATFVCLLVASTIAYNSSVQIPPVSAPWLALALVCILLNAILAGQRLTSLAGIYRYRVPLRQALRANAAGSMLAQVMISYLGHTVGRTSVLQRSGVAPSDTIELGLLERLAAFAVLGLAAGAAALLLYGGINLSDPALQLAAAIALIVCPLVALLVWLKVYREDLATIYHSGAFVRYARVALRALLYSLPIHMAMLMAYLALIAGVAGLSPSGPLIAACILVMFAAAIPISFGGWGVRELSAIGALALLDVPAVEAITISVFIGLSSLGVQIAFWFMLPKQQSSRSAIHAGEQASPADGAALNRLLFVIVPILVSIAIAFAVHVPTASGKVNANLADPLALIGLVSFLAYWWDRRVLPRWEQQGVNIMLAAISAVLVFAALRGYFEFGFSTWAFRNRLAGWVLLLGYVASGAVFAYACGSQGKIRLLQGFALTICCVACIELIRQIALAAGFAPLALASLPYGAGFAQNTNAQAVLLLAALAIMLALSQRLSRTAFILQTGILLAGLAFTQSRAGLGAAAIMLLLAMVMWWRRAHLVVLSMGAAVALVLTPVVLPSLAAYLTAGTASATGDTVIGGLVLFAENDQASDTERLKTIEDGLQLWRNNPLLGAGLGAYYERTAKDGLALVVHSTPIWLLAETGLIGFLIFAAAAGLVLQFAWKRSCAGDEVSRSLLLFLIGFAAMAMVHELLFQRIIWFIIGIAIATTGNGGLETRKAA